VANAPSLTGTTPSSPSSTSSTPTVTGTGEANATIKLYVNDNTCTDPQDAIGTITSGGTFSVPSVTVTQNATNQIYGKIVDLAGNTSACSAARQYIHDTSFPTMGNLQSVVATSTTSIDVNWTAGSDAPNAASTLKYDVCLKLSPSDGTCTGGQFTTSTNVTNYSVTGLTASTKYFVYVRAIDQVNYASAYVGPRAERTWGVGTNIAVSAGDMTSCSLISDGTVKCWGDNSQGQLGNNSTTNSLTPVTAGSTLTPAMGNIIAIAVGGNNFTSPNIYGFACALKVDGTVWCWGDDTYGQLGNNSAFTDSLVPVQVSGISNAVAITAGHVHACALLSTGGIKCWGYGLDGQLGNSASATSGIPVTVSTISTAIGIDAGYRHTCAVLGDGSARCWGGGAGGRLGNGLGTNSNSPVTVSFAAGDYAKAIDVGIYHSCALLADGTMRCWGGNASGQLGTNNTTQALSPVTVTTDGTAAQTGVIAISAGGAYGSTEPPYEGFTCAIRYSGAMICWGENSSGELGIGTSGTDALVPATVSGAANAKALSAGRKHACYLATNGTLECWGSGADGRLVTGNTTSVTSATPVANLTGPELAIQIRGSNGGFTYNSTGLYYYGNSTCALMSNGLVRCWGENDKGQLGTNDTVSRLYPDKNVVITGGSTSLVAKTITVGERHACAVTGNGTTYCWGANTEGQLGDGTTVDKSVATAVS